MGTMSVSRCMVDWQPGKGEGPWLREPEGMSYDVRGEWTTAAAAGMAG